jgi:carbon monoxide dehydrogenase subunit G
MAPITGTIEIARPPQDVFDYVADVKRQSEWQAAIEKIEVETDGPTRVGTRAVQTRRVPGGSRTFPYEVTEHDPPRRSSFQVTGGPVRPHGSMDFTALDNGTRTRVDFQIEFAGHGLGVLLMPIVRRDARREVPKNLGALKQRLESAG